MGGGLRVFQAGGTAWTEAGRGESVGTHISPVNAGRGLSRDEDQKQGRAGSQRTCLKQWDSSFSPSVWELRLTAE